MKNDIPAAFPFVLAFSQRTLLPQQREKRELTHCSRRANCRIKCDETEAMLLKGEGGSKQRSLMDRKGTSRMTLAYASYTQEICDFYTSCRDRGYLVYKCRTTEQINSDCMSPSNAPFCLQQLDYLGKVKIWVFFQGHEFSKQNLMFQSERGQA